MERDYEVWLETIPDHTYTVRDAPDPGSALQVIVQYVVETEGRDVGDRYLVRRLPVASEALH